MDKKKKRRVGRPELPEDEKRKGRIPIRVTESEKEELVGGAAEANSDVGTWMRSHMLKLARRRRKKNE